MSARARVWKARLKLTTAGLASESTSSVSTSIACTTKKYRCGMSPAGGAAPPYALAPTWLRTRDGPVGGGAPSLPAAAGSDVVDAGRFTSSQCQKPDGV